MMHHMIGFEVLDAMRAEGVTNRPSVIVLSAKSTHQDILDALERGADDFIPKPFDLEDLLLRVRVWLDRMRPSPSNDDGLRIFTLGPFRAFSGNQLLMDEETGDPRARALVKYLITERGQPVARGQVVYLLWPDLEEHEADAHLSRLLDHLKTESPIGHFLHEDGAGIRLTVDGVWVDADDFEAQVRTAQDAQEQG